jgi:hypothetical protein
MRSILRFGNRHVKCILKRSKYSGFKGLPAMLSDALADDFGNNLIDAWMARQGVAKQDITALDRLA